MENNSLINAARELKEIENLRDNTYLVTSHINSELTRLLSEKNNSNIADIFNYINEQKFSTTGEIRKLYNICQLIKNESIANISDFISDISTSAKAVEKYTQISFMLRRLTVSDNSAMINDAIDYLKSCKISIYGLLVIIGNEPFEGYEALIKNINSNIIDRYPLNQQMFYYDYVSSTFDNDMFHLKAANFCLNNNLLKESYKYLIRIKNKTDDIIQLTNKIKELIHE